MREIEEGVKDGLAPLVLRLGPREAVLYRGDRDGGADPERVVARAALPAQ